MTIEFLRNCSITVHIHMLRICGVTSIVHSIICISESNRNDRHCPLCITVTVTVTGDVSQVEGVSSCANIQ
jgi:hypothetical protein